MKKQKNTKKLAQQNPIEPESLIKATGGQMRNAVEKGDWDTADELWAGDLNEAIGGQDKDGAIRILGSKKPSKK